jgi:hypothetical protein
MTNEAPQFEGPLDNPDWTTEQNRRYDEAENRNTPQLAREEALSGEKAGAEEGTASAEEKDLGGKRASSPKVITRHRPFRARYKDTTDYVTRQLKDI